MIRVEWFIENKGAGSAEVDDVNAAATAVAGAVRDAYAPLGAQVQAHVLAAVMGPLRAEIVSNGRMAVGYGEEWTYALGGIFVTLAAQ